MPGELTRVFHNKYDLMHLNTPSFSSSVVTWDTSKLTPITKNRVLKAFKDGFIKFSSGDAANMYRELRRRFGIPEFTLTEPTKTKTGHLTDGYVAWGIESEEMTALLQPLYHAERVARRLEGNYMPWYLQPDELPLERTWFHYSLEHDMSEVKAYIDRTMASPELQAKRDEAIEFVETGGKLTFTWRQ